MFLSSDMHPRDPLVQTGGTLNVTCSLPSDYDGPYNSSDIYFRFDRRIYNDSTHITIINATTAEFTMEDMARDISGRHLFCLLPQAEGVERVVSGQQAITVGGKIWGVEPLVCRKRRCPLKRIEKLFMGSDSWTSYGQIDLGDVSENCYGHSAMTRLVKTSQTHFEMK